MITVRYRSRLGDDWPVDELRHALTCLAGRVAEMRAVRPNSSAAALPYAAIDTPIAIDISLLPAPAPAPAQDPTTDYSRLSDGTTP